MLGVEELKDTSGIPDRLWTGAACAATEVLFRLPRRVRVRFEGRENLPDGPTVFAPNHTHKFDFLPIRTQLRKENGIEMATWIKARDYQSAPMALFFEKTGNIPLSSRGYIISADFARMLGRRPNEQEYRALRAYVDGETDEAPDDPLFEPLYQTSRDILGIPFDLASTGYRDAIRQSYTLMMGETLELARRVRDAGIHQQIYPQGSVSSRLTPGKTGVVQAAVALDIPIVPIGMSGCREVFVGSSPLCRGGEITIRFGEPIDVSGVIDDPDFVPFEPESEERHEGTLREHTDRVMHAISQLVEPRYGWAPDGKSDAKTGVKRFF